MQQREWEGLVRVLTYGICQAPDAMAKIDTAFAGGIYRHALCRSPEQYLQALRSALASDQDIADVVGLPQGDAVVRQFLGAIEERLVREMAAGTIPPVMNRPTWERLVCDLLQSLATVHDPMRELDAAFDHWLAHGPLVHSSREYSEAVAWALSSDVDLAVAFAFEPRSGAAVRELLEALRRRLGMELGAPRRRDRR